jgi:hypothetical protein
LFVAYNEESGVQHLNLENKKKNGNKEGRKKEK